MPPLDDLMPLLCKEFGGALSRLYLHIPHSNIWQDNWEICRESTAIVGKIGDSASLERGHQHQQPGTSCIESKKSLLMEWSECESGIVTQAVVHEE